MRNFTASAMGHWGELFQGVVGDRHCLVSLPCPRLISTALYTEGPGPLSVDSAGCAKAARAAAIVAKDAHGVLRIESNIVRGKGFGSSTADCVATIRALLQASGRDWPDERIGEAVSLAEGASDSTGFSRAVLFAGRAGLVIQHYQRPLPVFLTYGIDTEKERRIHTSELPAARYSRTETIGFGELAGCLGKAIAANDLAALAAVSTESARMNQRFLATRGFHDLLRLAEAHRALGIAVAHSGTAAAFLFRPKDDGRLAPLARDLASLGMDEGLAFLSDQRTFSGQPKTIQYTSSATAATC